MLVPSDLRRSTRGCDALGFGFDIAAPDLRLTSYLDGLFSAFPAPEQIHHRYSLGATHDSGNLPVDLCLDGERVCTETQPEALVMRLVHDVNRRALDACPHLAVHAGGVEHSGIGIALPGVMTAGKTTLVTGLVRAGFGYLTDEAVAIERDALTIRPYPKPLSIDRDAWMLFPELEPHADLTSDAYKADQWQVPPSAIRADPLGRPCRIAVIVFPRHESGADTTLQPLGRAEALVEMAKNTFRFKEQSREALDLLAEVVRGAECYRLVMGELGGAVTEVAALMGAAAVSELARRAPTGVNA